MCSSDLMRSGRDNSFSGVGLDRADIVADIARPAGVDPVRQWYNTKAFVQNAAGTWGNSGRNIVNGPGIVSLNAMVSKSFTIYRESSLQFRAEFFNLPNHPNFNSPRTDNLTSGTYGRLTVAQDPAASPSVAKSTSQVPAPAVNRSPVSLPLCHLCM